jgi:hypothetical protein
MKNYREKETDDSSYAFDETSSNLKDVDDKTYSPFKLGKTAISNIMNKYLTRKFTEDIDYLQEIGGVKFLESGLKTSLTNGINDSDNMMITRIGVFDSNQPAPEKPISKYIIIKTIVNLFGLLLVILL